MDLVKGKELIRKLRQSGVEIVKRCGKGGHVLVRFAGRQAQCRCMGTRISGPSSYRRYASSLASIQAAFCKESMCYRHTQLRLRGIRMAR